MREASSEPRSGPGLIGKLLGVGRRLGWGVGLLYLMHRGLRLISGGAADLHLHRIVVQPVGKSTLVPDRLRGGVSVRVLAPDDAALPDALSLPEELGRRLDRGDACLAAFRDGRLVGHLWLCFAEFDDAETGCRFAAGDGGRGAWDFDMSISQTSRGGPVFAALWDGAWIRLRRGGYRWTASRVSAFNAASLRSHRRLGARPTGSLLVLRLGACRLLLATVRPYIDLGCRRALVRVVVRLPDDQAV